MILFLIGGFSRYKYWKFREKALNLKLPKIVRFYYIFRVKRMDFKFNGSFGLGINGEGATFNGTPNLPHGINGIIVHPKAEFGENCTLFQQVTVGEKNGETATIGNGVILYAGSKIIGNVTIGDNSVIGANAVVITDVPANSIAVGVPAKVINK